MLQCKGEPYRFSGYEDPLVQANNLLFKSIFNNQYKNFKKIKCFIEEPFSKYVFNLYVFILY